jgi:hypothetical protein
MTSKIINLNEKNIDLRHTLISYDISIIDSEGTVYKPELIIEGQQYHPFEEVKIDRSVDTYYLYIHVGYMGQPVSLQEKFSNCKIIIKFDLAILN